MQHEAAGDASSTATTESERGSSSLGGAGGGACKTGAGARAAARPLRPPIARNLRKLIDKFLHSTKYHVIIVCMVVFNWFIVIVELLINLRIFELGIQNQKLNLSISKILHLINVAMLGLFFMEMTLKACFIFGWPRFFRHRMEILDFVLVLSAFSLILAFGGKETSSDSAALLIVFRLWRVSKIINSMIAVVKHEAERKMAKERRNLRALEREVCKLRNFCLEQECELENFRQIFYQNQIPLPKAPCSAHKTTTTPPHTLNVIAEVNEMGGAKVEMGGAKVNEMGGAKKSPTSPSDGKKSPPTTSDGKKPKIVKKTFANRRRRSLRTIDEENLCKNSKILQYENENMSEKLEKTKLDDQHQNRHDFTAADVDETTNFLPSGDVDDGNDVTKFA